ncbi:MAG: cytochrome P450 [Actinomycetes bacterium]
MTTTGNDSHAEGGLPLTSAEPSPTDVVGLSGPPQLPFPRPDVLDVAPLYRTLQERSPVTLVRTPAGDLAWLVTGYLEAKALFADPRLARSAPDPSQAARISDSALLGGSMGDPATEATRHAQLRRLLTPAFSARRMQQLREHVGDLVADLLDRLAVQGRPADLHEALSFPLPVLVICELLGVPSDDRDRFRSWSEGASRLDDRAAATDSLAHLTGYMRQLVSAKRASPGEDVISDLLAAVEGPSDDVDEQVAGLAAMLLFAGHETTVTRIDFGTLWLLTNPEQAAALRADPDRLAPFAVEEILRVSAPSNGGELPRYAHADIDIAGITIRTGDAVLLACSAANRDPALCDDPDAFHVTRLPTQHLAFGHGPRYCLGASLARVELRAVFTALPLRLPTLRLAVPIHRLRLRADLLTGGLTELPVTW